MSHYLGYPNIKGVQNLLCPSNNGVPIFRVSQYLRSPNIKDVLIFRESHYSGFPNIKIFLYKGCTNIYGITICRMSNI